ncbi:MAG: hypothetical protein JW839_14055 [Candidatus Lokiarchaeota archaeon]|nr:hypothetical protein [Candidatus Lokiarchaeota archaeon]
MNKHFLSAGARFWLLDLAISSVNFFVLMNLVYEPAWGPLAAHQVGMSTRIACTCIIAWLLLRHVKVYVTRDLVHVGLLWLGLELLFEWGGSLAMGRPVAEILVGWNVLAGYMWPYVLAAYLLSNLAIGSVLRPGKGERAPGSK